MIIILVVPKINIGKKKQRGQEETYNESAKRKRRDSFKFVEEIQINKSSLSLSLSVSHFREKMTRQPARE